MTESEFLWLKVNDVVSGRRDKDVYYVIRDTDCMGTEYRGKVHRVLLAERYDGVFGQVRIDRGNCDNFTVEGRLRYD